MEMDTKMDSPLGSVLPTTSVIRDWDKTSAQDTGRVRQQVSPEDDKAKVSAALQMPGGGSSVRQFGVVLHLQG